MKRTWFFLPAAALLAAAPAQAQTLTWYGVNACWGGSTYSLDNGGYKSVDSNCSVDDDIVSNTWGQLSNSSNRSSVVFDRSNTPGGPLAPSSSISFSGLNDWTIFSLGRVTYNNGTVNPSGNTSGFSILATSNFNVAMFFDNSTTPTFNYVNQVGLTNNEDGGTDNVVFSGGALQAFSIGGYDYEFRIAGFDYSSQNRCTDGDIEDLDFLPETLQASAGNSVSGQLCGKIYYRGRSTVAEPATLSLVAAGLMGLVGMARRRRDEA